MAKWAGGFPLYLAEAHGNRITDVDGHHLRRLRPRRHRGDGRPLTRAHHRRGAAQVAEVGSITAMLPTPDAAWVAGELLALRTAPLVARSSATDANRWALRLQPAS
ncbi:MAG: hypothetical protein R2711_06685 [Acidimicrobiales bacterium]